MSKIKKWQEDEVQSQVQKAEHIISELIKKNYTDTLQQTKEIVAKDLDTGYTLKASALTGAFYFFNSLTNPINQPSIPGTIANKTVTAFPHPVA